MENRFTRCDMRTMISREIDKNTAESKKNALEMIRKEHNDLQM